MHRATSPYLPNHLVQTLSSALAGLLLAASVAACDRDDEEGEDDGPASRMVAVTTVERGDLVESVSLVGELQGIEEVRILSMLTDTVQRLPVREGDSVRRGDVLAVVSSQLTSSAKDQAEAGLDAAMANRDALQREVDRIRPLVEGGSTPRSQLESLEAQLRAAEAQVRQAEAGVGQASVQQGRTVIRSPISGVISAVTAQEGEIASPQMPLLTVVRPDPLKVVIRAPERHFMRIREGMSATLSPLSDRSTRVEAEVSLKGSVVDRMTRTGLVELIVENEDGSLMPGSLVRTEIEVSRKPDVILVPAEAVLFTGETETTGRATVFVAENGVARQKDVLLGDRQGAVFEVVQGLSEDETLVTRGAQFLRDEARIHFNESESRSATGDSAVASSEDGAKVGEGGGSRASEEGEAGAER